MAAYAALLSVMQTIYHLQIHPRPPISLYHNQVESLTQNITFLSDFLERYSGEQDYEELESRIAAAAYAAEDVIEINIVDQIHARSNISTIDLCQCLGSVMNLIKKEVMKMMGAQIVDPISTALYASLERVIADMDLIKKEAMEIINNRGAQLYDAQPSAYSSVSASSSTMAEFDEGLINKILDQLSGQRSNLQIISIDGMGGIGKTTFATNIYTHPLIVQRFDIRAWVTISQAYSRRHILLQVLCLENIGSETSDNELGERVHKKLWGRRYLIIMDDIWSVEAFDEVRNFFPENNNGSRIMITTRLSRLAFELSGSHVFRMNFLDEDKSWGLLCDTVFGKELGCPIELVNIGKEIARNCRGLPLSIVVIGGHLKKSNRTRAHWEYTLQNLSSLINLEDGEFCLRILHTSYKELPMHLKPCFLYMGIFREDYKIRVTKLIELWVVEGILKPSKDKLLEEVGEEYINELIDRNLLLVDELSWNGKAKLCKIHDLLRDVCLREAQKQRFLCVLKHPWDLNIPQCMNTERRICIHHNTKEKNVSALESASLSRSLVSTIGWPELVESHSSRLLRVYVGEYDFHSSLASVEAIFNKANLRFLTIVLRLPQLSSFPSSWIHLWNLQTLNVVTPFSWGIIMAPSDIWEMPLLRHVVIDGFELPDPVCRENGLILEYLQTLCVHNLKCSRAVIKRISNIKKLRLSYVKLAYNHDLGLNNIDHLKNLQSLHLTVQPNLVQNLCFPDSLKKLTLHGTKLNWEECRTKIGLLPILQYLYLGPDAFWGSEWETVEGQFCSLKVLKLECHMLRNWRTEDTHFPCLERLELLYLEELKEIPLSIGDIPTLKSIRLHGCSKSAQHSANNIEEEQLELGNMDLQIHIHADFSAKKPVNMWRYLEEVNETLKYQIEKYHSFGDLISDYNGNRIDEVGFIRKVKVLFKGHPSLIRGFNTVFLPPGYDEITLTDEEDAP